MSSLVSEGSLFSYLYTTGGATLAAIIAILVLGISLIIIITKTTLYSGLVIVFRFILKTCSKAIGMKERRYYRDLDIGKITEKTRRVKTYKFLHNLIIDLGIEKKGATPYEFVFLCLVGTLFITIIGCKMLFGSLLMVIVMYPIVFIAVMCGLYTKANISHDSRIEAVIEAENIICNNIKNGVVVSIRQSLNVIPLEIRSEFYEFLDNIEHKNYHIKTALLELNKHLGSVADDFIKKCIVFETEEEQGIVGMFNDVVEMNNTKMEMRTEMKRDFEEVTAEFMMGASMILIFLGGVLAIYSDVANFYFKTPLGQIVIAVDALILISEFVYITYLRAQEI